MRARAVAIAAARRRRRARRRRAGTTHEGGSHGNGKGGRGGRGRVGGRRVQNGRARGWVWVWVCGCACVAYDRRGSGRGRTKQGKRVGALVCHGGSTPRNTLYTSTASRGAASPSARPQRHRQHPPRRTPSAHVTEHRCHACHATKMLPTRTRTAAGPRDQIQYRMFTRNITMHTAKSTARQSAYTSVHGRSRGAQRQRSTKVTRSAYGARQTGHAVQWAGTSTTRRAKQGPCTTRSRHRQAHSSRRCGDDASAQMKQHEEEEASRAGSMAAAHMAFARGVTRATDRGGWLGYATPCARGRNDLARTTISWP